MVEKRNKLEIKLKSKPEKNQNKTIKKVTPRRKLAMSVELNDGEEEKSNSNEIQIDRQNSNLQVVQEEEKIDNNS